MDPETPTHLCKDCTYAKQVWSYLKQWLNLYALNSVDPYMVTGANAEQSLIEMTKKDRWCHGTSRRNTIEELSNKNICNRSK